MIQAIMSWAVGSWHVLESRLALLTMSRPDGPVSPLDLDPRGFLAVCEGILRESEENRKNLDEMYEAAKPAAPVDPAVAAAERRAQIDRLARLFGG